MRPSMALAAMGALATLLAACGSQPTATSVSARPTPVVAADSTAHASSGPPAGCDEFPPDLAGTWTVTIVPADLTPEVVDNKTGKVELKLGPGTSMTTVVGGTPINAPWACVMGNRLLMSEEQGGACAGLGAPTYTWRIEDGRLILTNLDDRCIARAFTNTVHTWVREP
jgi:hypothetical protein